MAETARNLHSLGSKAADFRLIDTRTNQLVSLNEIASNKATVIMFLSNHCPYVKHVQGKIVELAEHFQPQGITFIAISSNDVAQYPADSPENMRLEAEKNGYNFPYLFDESQETAKAYQAVCTPDFYIFDKNHTCLYRGCLDDSTPKNNKPLTGRNLQQALECILAGKPVDKDQRPSLGCSIKWKP